MRRPSEAGERLGAGIEAFQKKSQQYCWPSDGDIHSLVGGASSCKAFQQKPTGRRVLVFHWPVESDEESAVWPVENRVVLGVLKLP